MRKLALALMAIATLTFYNCSNEELKIDQSHQAPPTLGNHLIKMADGDFLITVTEADIIKGTRTPAPNYGCRKVSANGVHYAVEYNNGYAIVTFAVNGRLYSFPRTTLEGQELCNTDKNVFINIGGNREATEKFIKLQKSGKQLVLGRNGGAISIVCQQVGHLGDNEDVVQTKTTIWQDEYGTYWETFSWGGMIHSTLKVADQSLSGAYAAC